MNHELHKSVRLSLQRALLGAVTPSLRAVGMNTDAGVIRIAAYFDGPISEDDRESIEVAITEVIADFPDHTIDYRIDRVDAPTSPPGLGQWVYFRKEPDR